MISAITQRMKAFLRSKKGAFAMIGAIAATVLIGVGGAAYDFGKQQMAYKNAQQAADLAATSASGARLHETWGRVPVGGDSAAVLALQEARVRAYYRLNTAGYNIDEDFTPTITVEETADVYRTTVRGTSAVPSGFVRVLGIDSLPYTVETVTNLRNPGEQPNYDIVMLLDYTTSMNLEIDDRDTRLQAMRKAGKALTTFVMCGNEHGQNCDETSANNRIGMIPYGLTAFGLDPCDLPEGDPERPAECRCLMPRGFEGGEEAWQTLRGHEGGMPEDCRPVCDRVDSNNRPASDPFSDLFACECAENPVTCDMEIDGLTEIQRIFYDKCIPKCQRGACCPCKCGVSGPGGCGSAPEGTRACAEAMAASIPRTPCCDQPGPVTCSGVNPDTGEETGCGYSTTPSVQTVCCDMQRCTRSCTFSGGPEDPCAETPRPAWCDLPPNPPPPRPPRPPVPALGALPITPDNQLADTLRTKLLVSQMSSAVYVPGETMTNQDNPARLILAQASGGVWARSLRDCKDDPDAITCMNAVSDALLSEYLEGNTNSASAFEAFGRYAGYLDFMRPNGDGDADETVNVVVWLTDGLNNRFKFDNGGSLQPIIIPQSEWDEETNDWQPTNPDPDSPEMRVIRANRYAYGGQYIAEGEAGYDQALTAQQWADTTTLQHCRQLRERVVEGSPRPVIIYTIAVGSVGNLETPEGRHTARLMTECSYGIEGGIESDVKPADAPKKLFFAVQDSDDLNEAFRAIANSLGRIRIVD